MILLLLLIYPLYCFLNPIYTGPINPKREVE